MSGNLGYELDLTKLSEEDKSAIAKQISVYKDIREIVQFGDFYRILSPFEGNEAAWMFVSGHGECAVVFYFRVLAQPQAPIRILRLKGLNSDFVYRDLESRKVYGGDELMNAGFTIPFENRDFKGMLLNLQKI